MASKVMEYKKTPIVIKKASKKTINNNVNDSTLSKISTSRILWHLLRRHKFEIAAAWATVATVVCLVSLIS